jgi:hypothetical protein
MTMLETRGTLSFKKYAEKEQDLLAKMKIGQGKYNQEFLDNLNNFTNKVELAKHGSFCLVCDEVIENCKCKEL